MPALICYVTTAPAAATEAPATATDSAKPLPPPTPYVTAKADNVVPENVAGEVNPFMSGQLLIFVQQKGRMPVSFTDFANTRLDSITPSARRKKMGH